MTEKEAAVIIKDLLYLNRDSGRTEFIKALEMSIQALKNEARRKAYLKYLKENMHYPDMRSEPYITQHKIHALEECEV